MNYQYEFVTLSPKQMYAMIKFSSEGKPDVFKNIITRSFDEQHLNQKALSLVPSVIDTWNTIEAAPESVTLDSPVVSAVYKPTVSDEMPQIDISRQKLVRVEQEEESQITVNYLVEDLSGDELLEAKTAWREGLQVTMRQARLALIQQGLLGSVNAAIAQMPEPDKSLVETEWEYASTVERGSPWIAAMTSALGLTDEQMDDLFRLAATL